MRVSGLPLEPPSEAAVAAPRAAADRRRAERRATPPRASDRRGRARSRWGAWSRGRRWIATIATLAVALVAAYPFAHRLIFPPAVPRYVPRDPLLRDMPVSLFPAAGPGDTARAPRHEPRGLIVFYGNDGAFTREHQKLAERLSKRGYDVVGVDVVQLLQGMPSDPPAARDSAFAASVRPLVERVRREFAAPDAPVILAGHSFGADLAIWTAAYAPPRGTVGVLAMGPGSRGHLGLSAINPLERLQNPTGPGTFSTADAIRATAPEVRVAVVRGGGDVYREADPGLTAAGGPRLRRTLIPLGGHAFRRLLIAGPLIERDTDWLVDSLSARRAAPTSSTSPAPAPRL